MTDERLEARARRGDLYRIEVFWSEVRTTLVVAVLLGLSVWRLAEGEWLRSFGFMAAAIVWTVLSGTSSVKDGGTSGGSTT